MILEQLCQPGVSVRHEPSQQVWRLDGLRVMLIGFGRPRPKPLSENGRLACQRAAPAPAFTGRLPAQWVWVFMQFPKYVCSYISGEKWAAVTNWLLVEGDIAVKYFGADNGELPTVVSDNGMEKIFRFDVRSSTPRRRPQRHETTISRVCDLYLQ